MTRKVDFKLYLITDRKSAGGRPLVAVVRDALAGGVRAVQFRDKKRPIKDFLSEAQALRVVTKEFGALLFINDRVDVCLAVGADGVHLNQGSIPIHAARKILGPDRLIGFSAHSSPEVVDAEKDGADFVVLGPVYDTPSKRGMGKPIGLDPLQSASKNSIVPVFAVGGVNPKRLGEIFQKGVNGIAVISAILEQEDVKGAAFELLEKVKITQRESIVPRK